MEERTHVRGKVIILCSHYVSCVLWWMAVKKQPCCTPAKGPVGFLFSYSLQNYSLVSGLTMRKSLKPSAAFSFLAEIMGAEQSRTTVPCSGWAPNIIEPGPRAQMGLIYTMSKHFKMISFTCTMLCKPCSTLQP